MISDCQLNDNNNKEENNLVLFYNNNKVIYVKVYIREELSLSCEWTMKLRRAAKGIDSFAKKTGVRKPTPSEKGNEVTKIYIREKE